MKKAFLLLTTCWLLAFSYAQPVIQWQNTIGGNHNDWLRCIQQTNDGGYIMGGDSRSVISCDKTEGWYFAWDFWVVKTDSTGSIQYQNTISGYLGDDYVFSIQQTVDGGYILGAFSDANISSDKSENCLGGFDYWLIKLDSSLTIQWENTIGGNADDRLYSVKQTTDGGYILGGYSYSNISVDKTENSLGGPDYWVIKTDSAGFIQWQNTIGGNGTDWLTSIQQTNDGGYFIGGYSGSGISGDKTENSLSFDFWVVKLDATGNILWQNTIGGGDGDYLMSANQTADGGFILGGYSNSNISGDKTENSLGLDDYWVVKLDIVGNIQWQNTIGGDFFEELNSVQQTTDGGYILGGWSLSTISGDKTEDTLGSSDYWVIKLDSLGNIQWQNTIGGNKVEYLHSIQQTADEGYILGGYSNSNISGDKTENPCDVNSSDFWIIKLAPDSITGISNLQPPASNFQIFPNPADDVFTVSGFQFSVKRIEIINLLGETVFSTKRETVNCKLQTSFLPPGIYIIKVYADEGVFQQKLVINR